MIPDDLSHPSHWLTGEWLTVECIILVLLITFFIFGWRSKGPMHWYSRRSSTKIAAVIALGSSLALLFIPFAFDATQGAHRWYVATILLPVGFVSISGPVLQQKLAADSLSTLESAQNRARQERSAEFIRVLAPLAGLCRSIVGEKGSLTPAELEQSRATALSAGLAAAGTLLGPNIGRVIPWVVQPVTPTSSASTSTSSPRKLIAHNGVLPFDTRSAPKRPTRDFSDQNAEGRAVFKALETGKVTGSRDPTSNRPLHYTGTPEWQSFIRVPIFWDKKLIGMLTIESEKVNDLHAPDDQDLAIAIAELCAVAMRG